MVNINIKRIVFWLPRVLAIGFIAFLSMFALDVFDMPQWFFALLMHLIPSFILVILTAVAWKNRMLGGLLFIFTGLTGWFFIHSTVIVFPTLIIGILFASTSSIQINKKANKRSKN